MDEIVHQFVVARDDDDEVLAVVLHRLQDRVDRLLAEVVFGFVGERVRFVDEEESALRAFDDLRRLDRGLADVAGDETRTVDFDEVALREDAEGVVDARHDAGDGRLTGTGVAAEDHMEREVGDREAGFLPHVVDHDHADQVVDLAFDAVQTDVGVELGLDLFDRFGRFDLFRRRGFGGLFALLVRGPLAGGDVALFVGFALPGLLGRFRLLRGIDVERRFGIERRMAEDVVRHVLQAVFGHRADDFELLEDDFVFFVHGVFS